MVVISSWLENGDYPDPAHKTQAWMALKVMFVYHRGLQFSDSFT
jgi:hypothetical protein